MLPPNLARALAKGTVMSCCLFMFFLNGNFVSIKILVIRYCISSYIKQKKKKKKKKTHVILNALLLPDFHPASAHLHLGVVFLKST